MKMATSANPSLLFLLILSLLPHKPFTFNSDSDPLSELQSLQSESKSGIIHLNNNRFHRVIKPPRKFHLLIFFDAFQLHSKADLHLKDLKYEFSLLAKSFITNNNNTESISKIFFCDIEYRESQSTFKDFGVRSVPYISLVGPNDKNLESDPIQMNSEDYSGLAESMAQFVEIYTHLTVGPIHRPPIISSTQFQFIFTLLLISSPFLIKKVIAGNTVLHDWRIYLAGAVFIYFFSVSGTMHIIIRKMPMILSERKDPSKLVFFYHGSGMQLGAEGFTIGFLYTSVGILLAFMTHSLVMVKEVQKQRIIMITTLIVCFWCVKKVVFLDNWKTGYSVHAYWPSSWI